MEIRNNRLKSIEADDIENGTFLFPDFIEHLDNKCFENHSKLINIEIPSKIQTIGEECFTKCSRLENVVIDDSVKFIGKRAFKGCLNLTNIKLPKDMQVLTSEMFLNCYGLKEIEIPSTIQMIGVACFWGCMHLEKINLPEGLEVIGKSCFGRCRVLNPVLPKSLKIIEDYAFEGCKFKTLSLPENLEILGDSVFTSCPELKYITIPDKIKILVDTFNDCPELESVVLPKDLEILDGTFSGCSSLKNIEIPDNTKIIRNAFMNCDNLQQVSFPKNCKFYGPLAGKLAFITKQGDRFILSEKPINDTSLFIKDVSLNISVITSLWEDRENLLRRVKQDKELIQIYNKLQEGLTESQFVDVYKNGVMKFFKQIAKIKTDDKAMFYKLCYTLGAFSKPINVTRTTKSGKVIQESVNYAQKVCEFFKDVAAIEQVKVDFQPRYKTIFQHMKSNFQGMSDEGFKKEFTDFFLEKGNFDKIISQERLEKGFFVRCYNLFEEVQKTNTSNKGKQRQLKPTIEKFIEYFQEKPFAGENDKNQNIAKTIKPYFSSQATFNDAVEIEEERERLGTGTRILKNHIEEQDVFSRIDELTQKIQESAIDSLHILTDLANKAFTFEFLEKNDPRNYILGKLCSCCAHLEAVGFGIMRASIVHPDLQNIVIKDKKGEIIAKTTIYVNREEGYAICNTFALSERIDGEDYPAILEKLRLAIKVFAETYNQENPDKPLKQVNVGLGMNDLEEFLTEDRSAVSKILKPFDFKLFGKDGKEYQGDSKAGQVVIWKNELTGEKENEDC